MGETRENPRIGLGFRDNPGVGRVELVRRTVREDEIRARAEELAREGSPAAALALMTTAAEDLESRQPHAVAVLLAEASWYARLAYGSAHALQVARRATEFAGGADGRVAVAVHARLGDALQWNGRYAEARSEWLRAAACRFPPEPRLLRANMTRCCLPRRVS